MGRNQFNWKGYPVSCCIYRSPTNGKSLTAESTKRVSNAIKQAMDRKKSHILV